MLVPMSPTNSLFLLVESREHPMHVGALELFRPPDGADARDLTALLDHAMASPEVAPLFAKRARRGLTSLAQWGWELDPGFDLEHHVRRNALPRPGRVRELLTLCSRLHSTLLDRHRPLWEMNLIEGLDDGRLAVYFKAHHALVDGVSALRMLARMLSMDSEDLGMPPFWAPRPSLPDQHPVEEAVHEVSTRATHDARSIFEDVLGIGPALLRAINRGLNEQGGSFSFSAPRSMFNVPVTGARRFAAQSWPMDRVKQIGKAADATVNDVVLAMCSGALRSYLLAMYALPDAPLIAMVPVSLHQDDESAGDGSGNSVGAVMCNLGTTHDDPAQRLATVRRSMLDGKEALREMTPLQTLAMTALGVSPLGVYPLLRLDGKAPPPFNLIISNVPGPRQNMYWNGWRLDGLYPLSVVLDGQALNITVTSFADAIAFGLTGCRRSVPHLQRLLGYLDDELNALELAVGV
jgi:diacylglycerol O-acyltransferase